MRRFIAAFFGAKKAAMNRRTPKCLVPIHMPLLEIENVSAGYGPIEVLKGISIEVREGEIVTMIGANGAGKTTTLMSISGVNRIRGGFLRFGDRASSPPAHEIVHLGLCHSPEGRKIFPRLTVLENLQMGAFTRRITTSLATSSMSSTCSRFFASERLSKGERSPGASSRCWPSPVR